VLKPSLPSCRDAKSPGVIIPDRSRGDPGTESGLDIFCSVPPIKSSKSSASVNEPG
jgi:hypothetical protein